jgi:GT2 family glycosyltransferase
VRRILAPPAEGAPPPTEGPQPTFSAIVAAYQAAGFIADALDSLLAQTLSPLEIIVCDDGSTDDLDAALDPFKPHIALLRKENGGEASAKNLAAHAASGDFLAILDADDVYFPERLEALAELSMRRPDLDILTTDCRVMVDGQFVRNCYHNDFPVDDQRAAIVQGNFVGPGHMAVRRQAFLAIGGFDESLRWATDWDCWIRMIFAGSRVGLVDEPLAEYRIRETGLASDRTRLIECRVTLLDKAGGRTDLSPEERMHLDGSLREQRRLLALYSTRQALVESRPEARRLALSLALNRSFPWPARLKAALAVAVPGRAGKYLAQRDRQRHELAGEITL